MQNGVIVVLTGAGISKESGLATFRDADGEWARVELEDVATPEGYRRNPDLVHAFYNARRKKLQEAALPNAAHLALARLEQEWPDQVLVVTQNIDDLHERAGSRNLIHMHGELLKGRCDLCGTISPWAGEMTRASRCPSCQHPGRLRPHVVWFGEMPLDMPRIYRALETCRLFIAIGTSGNVYPAAGFVTHVQSCGHARTVELNLEPSLGATLFQQTVYGPASQVVPDFVARLLAEASS